MNVMKFSTDVSASYNFLKFGKILPNSEIRSVLAGCLMRTPKTAYKVQRTEDPLVKLEGRSISVVISLQRFLSTTLTIPPFSTTNLNNL